jgi:hypothetical protein
MHWKLCHQRIEWSASKLWSGNCPMCIDEHYARTWGCSSGTARATSSVSTLSRWRRSRLRVFRISLFGFLPLYANDTPRLFRKFSRLGTSPEPFNFLLGNEQVAVNIHRRNPTTVPPTKPCGAFTTNLVEPKVKVYPANYDVTVHKDL